MLGLHYCLTVPPKGHICIGEGKEISSLGLLTVQKPRQYPLAKGRKVHGAFSCLLCCPSLRSSLYGGYQLVGAW